MSEYGKMKAVRRLRWIMLAVVCLGASIILSSCGREEISLTIKDGNSETTVTAYTGNKVESVLEEAEINVGENDVVTPEMDYKLTTDDTEILIERYAAVTVVDGEDSYELELVGKTVADAVSEAGLILGENDTVDQELDTYLTDGMVITVTRAYNVTLILDGETSEIMTSAATIKDFIEEQEIDLGDEYEISPDEDTALEDGMEIVIKRTITEQVVEEEEIAFDTTYENSSSMYSGETSVKQEGVNGKKEVTYEVTYVNGEETGREVISENVIEEPVNKIILQGTKSKSSSSSSSSSSSKKSSSSDGGFDVDDCDGSGHGVHYVYDSDGNLVPAYEY